MAETSKAKKTAAWVAIALAAIGAGEGLRTVAYRDPVGIPTFCFGDTRRPDGTPVQLGDRATVAECEELLGKRVELEYGPAVDRCVHREMPAPRKAAFTSLAYNIGTGAFCKSSIVRKYNAGDTLGACNAITLYDNAKSVRLPGLVNRRARERELCMEGLT